MTTSRAANFLTPIGGISTLLAIAAFIAMILFAAGGMGFRFDPFNRTEHRAERAEAVAVTATSDASARSAEVQGAREVTVAVERASHQVRAAEAIVQHHQQLAEEAPDAHEALDPGRSDRLADADRCLCELSPRLCTGDPAPPRDAGDGEETVCPAPPA